MQKRIRTFSIFSACFLALGVFFLADRAVALNFNLGSAWQAFFEYTGFYGNGSDGAITVSGVPNGPANPYVVNDVATSLSANASVGATSVTVASITGFSSGKEILVIQMEGTSAGTYEFVTLSGAAGSTLSLNTALKNNYTSANKVQVILVKQYTTVTINSGGFLTVPNYSSATGTGGVLVMKANTSLVVNDGGGGLSGTVSVGGGYGTFASRGYVGGTSAAGAGPGGGTSNNGGANTSPGVSDALIMGSGGGSSANTGGNGGGLIIIKAKAVMLNGNIYANGAAAASGNAGGGAGGTIYLSAETIATSASCGTISADTGNGIGTGTAGSAGRIFVNYLTSSNCQTATPAGVSNYRKFYLK